MTAEWNVAVTIPDPEGTVNQALVDTACARTVVGKDMGTGLCACARPAACNRGRQFRSGTR